MLFSSIVCWLWLISLVPIASILLLTCCGCKRKSPTEKKNKLVNQQQKNELVNHKLVNQQQKNELVNHKLVNQQQKNELVNHKLIYHEKQIGRMCALHALNMLLQGRHFTFANLVTIAREIDQRERSLLTGSKQLPNGNYDSTGYFSIQVITEALRRKANLNLVPLDSPNMLKIRENPNLAQAFICHHNDHWFTLRKFGTTWFELNSLKEAPKIVPDLILEFWEIQYCRPGWCIYVVEGKLPSCAADVAECWRKQPKKPMKRTICSRIFGGKETGTERSDVEYLDETAQLQIDNNILDDELTSAKEKKMEPMSHNSESETSHPTL